MKGPSLFAFLPSSPPPRPFHCLESLLSFKHFPSAYFPKVSCLSRALHLRKGREKILQKSHPGPVLIFPRIRTQKDGVGSEKTNFSLGQHVESKKSERLQAFPSSRACRRTPLQCKPLFPQECGSGFGKYVF